MYLGCGRPAAVLADLNYWRLASSNAHAARYVARHVVRSYTPRFILGTSDPTGIPGQDSACSDEDEGRRQGQAVQPLRPDRVTDEPGDEPCDSHRDRDRCSSVQTIAPHPSGR